jgi:putative ATPase
LYPHAFRDHWVAQQYLPSSLQGKVFYQPSDQGYEAQIRVQVARRREEQLAAMLAAEDEHVELLTFSPDDPQRERWLQRTISGAGARLGRVRDRVLDACRLPRHGLVLDLKAGSGLLTWEALRRVPEGGVYALARSRRDADALRQLAERLPQPERPVVFEGRLDELPLFLRLQAGPGGPHLREVVTFDAVVGYNALIDEADKAASFALMGGLLGPGGVISLAERVPAATQRIYRLVDARRLDADLLARWGAAEEAIYDRRGDPLTNWDAPTLLAAAESAGLAAELQTEEDATDMQVTAAVLARWFTPAKEGRASYADHLAAQLAPEEIAALRALCEQQMLGQTVAWRGQTAYLVAHR